MLGRPQNDACLSPVETVSTRDYQRLSLRVERAIVLVGACARAVHAKAARQSTRAPNTVAPSETAAHWLLAGCLSASALNSG